MITWEYLYTVYNKLATAEENTFTTLKDAELYMEFKNEQLEYHDLYPSFTLKIVPCMIGGEDDDI